MDFFTFKFDLDFNRHVSKTYETALIICTAIIALKKKKKLFFVNQLFYELLSKFF